MEDNKRKLYDALSNEFDLGTYEEFERNIGDSVKRQKLYDAASADYDLGDFESYSQKIGPTHRENLEAFTAEHGSFLNDFEARDTAETKRMMASARSGAYMPSENAISGEERQRYMELHKQEEALKKAWYTSDEYLAQKDADALYLSNISKGINKELIEFAQANPVLRQEGAFQINPYATRGAEADTELEKYRTASRIMDDAIKIHNAPSRYDGENVFLKFGKGAGDILSDADFWTAGLTEIADNFGVRSVLKSVQDKLGNLNDLSEEAIENKLSPAEKAVLQAWAINAQEQLKRKDDLSRAYQAGQGATESLGFMAEFALTGGVGKLASESVESMAKWLSKKAMTKIGGMADDVAEKVLKETGEKIANNAVGKYGTRLAESLAEAAGRTGVMPSTFRNISEKATEIRTDEEGNNYLVGMNNAFAKGFVDSFIENLSEGGRVNALGELLGDVAGKVPAYKKMVDKFSNSKASELLEAFNSSGIMNTLRAGGWHGLGEEYLEEWYGNALRTLTGVDKEALKEFATVDNQIVTLTSFLPMTIFGGTVGTAQVLSATRDLEKKSAALKSALLERGYDEAQANNMIDMMRGSTPAEVSEFLSPIVNSVARRSVDEAAALMKPVGEFAAAVRRWQAFDTKYKYQEQEQRDNLRAQMEETLGQFWQEDENGRQTVQRGINESGEMVYLLGKPSAEETETDVPTKVAAITSDGRKVFVNPSDYELDDELEMNEFLGTEIMAEKGNREKARMVEERDAQNAAIREAAVPGTAFNIGTAEAPIQAIVIQRNPDGVIVNTPDGQARQMTLEEFGNYVGINAVPMTDAQIDEQEADALSAERAQREAELDQEYSNEDSAYEEITEAEDEIERATEVAEPLPLKADGSVDQTALWNNDPERWAEWNDEQRQDGGANSLAYINGAIAKESARIAEMQAGYDAISDFDERDAVEREVAAIRDRLQRLVNLRDGYVAQAEAPISQTQQRPQTEEEKAKAENQRREPLRKKAKELADKLGVKVNIAESISDVKEAQAKEEILRIDLSGSGEKATGWFNAASGEVTIYLPHTTDAKEIERTVVHEVVAHKGLRGLLGEEGFNVLCDSVWDMMTEEERAKFMAYPGVNGNKRAAADEYIAHYAETLNLEESKPVWDRIMDLIMRILNSMGVRLEMSKEQLSDIIVASYQKLVQEANGQTNVESAEASPDKGVSFRLSEEVDENGRQFVLTPNGELAFGEITSDSGLTPAPILLSEGMITNPVTNDGYGLVHIEARHGDQIRKAGYNSVIEFVEEVAKNYEVIREGKNREGVQTYMLQLTDKHNNTLMVELSGDGTYWNINTAGIFKTSYGANRREIYNRHTTDKQSAETAEASQATELSGTQPTSSMNAPTSSEDKVSENIDTYNTDEEINEEPSSPFMAAAQQEGEAIRFSITTEESLQEKIRKFAKTKDGKATKWSEDDIESIIAETESLIDAIHRSSTGNEFYDEFAYKEPTIRVDWRDGEAKPIVTWTRANIEYKYDMSADLLCINNEGLEQVLSSDKMVALMEMFIPEGKVKKGETPVKFTAEDYLELYNTLRDLGFVVPCKGCFDAAGRFKMLPSVAQKFAAEVNAVIDERNKDPKAFDEKLKAKKGDKTITGLPAKASTKSDAIAAGVAGDNLTEHVKWTQLMSADGQTKMLSDWGGIFRAWQRTGAGRPKDKLLPEPYYGDIVSSVSTIIGKYGEKTPSFRDTLVNQGTGLRRNSHSEFRPVLAIDEIQFMRDAFIRNLTVFKYMKELDDVRLFGKMGVKFNMSFFPEYVPGTKVAGLDKDGNYIASEESVGSREFPYQGEDGKRHYDGMKGWAEAQKYVNKDVSLSSVIFSIPHLLKALTDVPTPSDMRGIWGSLIPFHSSGATTASLAMQGLGMARANGVGHGFSEAFSDYGKGVTNFEAVQNDRFGEGWYIVSGKKAGENVEPGHKLEFANGNHYYNRALGIHLFASGYILDSELPEGVLGEKGELNITDEQKKALLHKFTIDYNDKVRDIKGPDAYKAAADYYIAELPKLGLIPRFDFEVSEEKFLEMCEAANVDPRHPKLGWKGEGNSWSPIDSEAYYSLFCDYGMTDPATGEWAPHMPVGYVNEKGEREFRLPENAVEIVKDGLERFSEVRRSENARIDEAIETFAERSVEKGRISQKDVDKVLGKKATTKKASKSKKAVDAIDLVEEARKAQAKHDAKAKKSDVSFRITPEQDKAYMDAVEAGDMETAQRMVIEAAKLAMPNTKVVDENGNPKVVYHGSTAMFTIFDKSRIGSATGTADGRGFYFTTDRDYALGYKTPDGQLFEVFLNIEKPLSYDKKTITKAQLRKILKEADRVEYEQEGEHYMLSNYANYNDVGIDGAVNEGANLEYDYADNDVELVGSLIGGSGSFDLIMDAVKKVTGKSGMIAPKDNGTIHYVVTDPAGIKSAEPVTYDNNGNVIPLSERFNPENEDIRFRTSNNNQAIFVSNAAKAVEGIKQEKAIPEQWLKMIEKAGGLKAGEDKWMGLSDFLKSSDKKTLTKQEVLDFINENMIQIEEVHYDAYAEERASDAHSNIVGVLQNKFNDYVAEYHEEHGYDDEYDDPASKYAIERLREEMEDTFPYTIELVYGNEVYVTFDYEEEDEMVKWAEKTGVNYIPDENPINSTRLNYTTDGLENKHEIALTVPTIESWNEYDEIHFGDAGDGRAVAWIRFGETTINNVVDKAEEIGKAKAEYLAYTDSLKKKYDIVGYGMNTLDEKATAEEKETYSAMFGKINELQKEHGKKISVNKRVLVIDEIQSKRHQEGREKGYKPKDYWPLRTKYLTTKTVYDSFYADMEGKYGEAFSEASTEEDFRKVMSESDFSQMLRIKEDFDRASNAYIPYRNSVPDAPFDKNWHELAMKRMLRYAAEEGYDVIAWTKGDQQAERYNLGGVISEIKSTKYPRGYEVVSFGNNGNIVHSEVFADESAMAGVYGKEMAQRIIKSVDALEPSETATISGDNLRIGGEGMKGFYDKMLPAFMNKYGKKWGVKVEDIDLPDLENGLTMHSVPVTEEMKASVMEGQVMFRVRGENESTEEFVATEIPRFQGSYNVNAPIILMDYSSKESAARSLGIDVKDMPDYMYDNIKELAKENGGAYVKELNTILIFAQDYITTSGKADNVFFHEGAHSFITENPHWLALGEWLLDNAASGTKKKIADVVRMAYEEDEYVEEMLTSYTGLMLSLGRSQAVMNSLPTEMKPIWEEILNKFNYIPEYEDTRRKSERAGDEDARRDAGVPMRNTDGEKAVRKGKISWKQPAGLTSKERRVINEYFPGAFRMTDSKGNTLTPAQEEFFANSKAVDKDGNLLVLYHGTPRAGFTEFKSGWFTTSKEDAISYSGDRKGRMFDPNEKYEPETLVAGDFPLGYMTFDSEEDRAEFLAEYPEAESAMSEAEFDSMMLQADEEYDDLIARKPELQKIWNAYREYERERFVDTTIGDIISNPEAYTEEDLMRAMLAYDSNASLDSLDDMDAAERKDALVSALQNANEETEGGILDMVVPTRVPRNGEGVKHNDLGNRTYEVYANVENPYEIDANGRGSEFESGDIYKSVEEALADEQYDGVIIRNWRVGRTQQLGDVVVPKNGSQIKLTINENPTELDDIRFSIRTKPAPKKTGKGYKVFYLKDGKLYPPMVANLGGVDTPVGVWLDAEEGTRAGVSKTGRPQVKQGGKGTQGGSGTLAYRPGWHLGEIPYAIQFNRKDENGDRTLFPADFVWAEVEYANDVDYQEEAMSYGMNANGKFQHSLAGLPKLPTDGSYRYRTNPNPETDPWIITGAMKVNRLLTPSEVDQMVIDAGREPQKRQEGAVTDAQIEELNKELGLVEEEEEVSIRTTGTPTEDIVAEGVSLSPAQLASLAGDIFAALPEESRKKITDGLNGNILGLQDAILQIPTTLATKEDWNGEDRQMAEVVAEQMTKAVGIEMTRPFSASEALWTLYNAVNKSTDLVSEASRALVRRNLGFDSQTLEMEKEAKDGVRFRTVGNASANAQASMYNRGAANVWTRLKESYVDMHASVEELVKAIEKRSGKVAQGFENILMALNQQSSKGLAAMEAYEQKFLNKMFDAIRKIMDKTDFKYEDIVRYVILKHGLERNVKMAQRDAKAHYQEIYDDIIAKIKGMNPAQKRTYLTNAQLRDADAKAELARLQAVNTSILTPDQLTDYKKEIAKAKKEAADAAEHLVRAQKIATMTEQDAQDELDKIFDNITNESDSVYQEMRKNDYSGISSMFYDTLGVDRKNFATEEEYQSALMQAKADKYDNLGDIEGAAQMEVTLFEKAVNTDNLWKRINAATKETLRQQYEANMISKDQYDNLRNMFEFYVPLRGFKDNTAEDMYTYYRRPNSTGYTKPILGAEGRKTEAESPFGWIAAMAGSAIASNVKNEAKLALYYFVANRPDNGIATLSRTWFVHTPGDVDANGKKIFRPAYPSFNADLSTDAAKQAYEDWQEQMRDLQKQGLAYESGQRLNLGNSVVNISDTNKPEHIVNVKVGGKDYTIVINGNPRAAQAINGDLNIEGTSQDYSALFGPVLRWMSSVNTSYNPEFWITNMMRDMAFTMMAVNIKEDPAYRRKFFKNYAKAFKVVSMVAKNENGSLGNSYIEQQYKDFVKYGGVTGHTQIKDSETWEKEIENYLASNDPASIRSGKAMRGMKTVFHAVHRFGESLEQVSRFAAFLTAVETGKSINEAINDAKEITMNFNRKGSGKMITLEEAKYLTDNNGQPLNKFEQWAAVGLSSIAPLGRRFIMFFNAAIQGLNATYKLYAKNKTRAIGWALGYAAVGMMNAVLHAMLDDDDDYLDIPQYERRNSLMIGGNGAYFKWALPQEARAFYALGDLAVESVMGRNPHQSVIGEALKISTEILPVNPSEGWKAFMPSVAIPFVELVLNEDYKGAPIYNEQKWLTEEERERSTKWSKAYQGTGDLYVGIAKGLNAISGGDEHDAGLINLQPEKMQHIVQSAFGGTIRTADKLFTTIIAAFDPEEDITARQFPFLNRFLTINDERFKNVHVNDVYDYYAAEAEHTISLQKKYTKDRNADALKDLRSSDEYKWARVYSKYKKPIKKYQEAIRAADTTNERMELMKQQDELKRKMIKEISEL